MLTFCGLSSCIVLKRQKILTRFLSHTTAPCPSQIASKFGLHRSTTNHQSIALSNGIPSHNFPFPQNGVPNAPRTNFSSLRDTCCHMANMIRYRQDSCVLCRMSLWAERCRPLSNLRSEHPPFVMVFTVGLAYKKHFSLDKYSSYASILFRTFD